MSYVVKRIDGTNASLKACKELFRVMLDAFRSEPMLVSMSAPDGRLDDESLPSIADFEQLKNRVALFENRVNVRGINLYKTMITDPRTVSYALVNSETNHIVAMSLWKLPTYSELPFKPSIGRKLYGYVLGVYEKLYERLYPLNSPYTEFMAEVDKADEQSGLYVGKPHTIESLKALDRKELEEIEYPKDYAYYLAFLAVRANTQGHGFGKKMLQGAISEISQFAKPPPEFNGPAKLLWQSAPLAIKFYQRLGYHKRPTLVTLKGFEHAVFFTNVD